MLKTLPKLGDRVKVLSLNIKGTITHINEKHLFVDYLAPIQIELDEPWDSISSVQKVYRTGLKDLRGLKKVKKVDKKTTL